MQEAKKDNRGKYTYVTDHADFNAASKHEISACRSCLSWEQKTQDLIWGYEQLLSAKEKELETVTNMVNQLDEKLKKSYLKIENLNKKIQGYENQIDKVKGSQQNHEGVISYYKEREAELLLQLKSTENQLFAKNVQISDEIDCKEERALNELLDHSSKINRQRIITPSKSQANLDPIIQTSETFGKMLQRNLCDLEKMSQQKMMLQVKHRMAVLRAVELSILK